MKGILTLTALSFVSLFGLSRTMERIPNESKAMASVAGKKITVAQYINGLSQKIRSIGKVTQRPFTIKDAVENGLLPHQLSWMLLQATQEAMVDYLNVSVPEDDVRAEIKKMPAFAGSDGSFNFSVYKRQLGDMGLSEKEFVKDLFTDMRLRQIKSSVGALSVVSPVMAELNYRIQNEKRSGFVFSVNPAELKIAGKPSAAEKEELYRKMAEDLMSPEYRSFTVMRLTTDEVAKKIQISEEELKEVFEENKADYTVEEIRDVDQMLFTTREEADKAYAALQQGRNFMDVAKTFARQTEDQTKLGEITPSSATEDWGDVVFSAKKGEVVAPVQTAFGWQILRVNKITPKIEKTFKEVRNEIRRKLIAARAFEVLSETAVALDDRFGAGETIEDAAKSTGFPLEKYTFVDPNGKDEAGRAVNVSPAVLEAAFLQEAGKESPMIEDGSGFFVLRVDDVLEPAVRPIEKSEKEIYAAWLEAKQHDRAKEIAEEIEELLNKGATPKAVLRKTGIASRRLNEISRQDKSLPESLVRQLFNQPVKTVISQSFDKEFLIAKVVSATQADPKKDPVGVEKLRDLVKDYLAEEKFDTFLADFAVFLNSNINKDIVEKTYSYLSKSVQESEED